MFLDGILRSRVSNLRRWRFLSRQHDQAIEVTTKQAAPEGSCVNLTALDLKIGSLPATPIEQCHQLYEFVLANSVSQILELGFYFGKSSTYMAAALAAKGRGLVTTIDLQSARSLKPSILEVAAMTALAPYINPIFSDVGSAWEMRKLIVESTDEEGHCKPVFDFCFIDAFHSCRH